MQVYRMEYHDPDDGSLLEWHSAKKDAVRRLKYLQWKRGTSPAGPEGIEKVYIPTDKDGLIRWLNFNLSTDNG